MNKILNSEAKRFAIIGAGIGGLTLAIALQRKGLKVTVYESAPEIKALGAGLGLAANAIKAFDEIGIGEAVLKAGRKLKSVAIMNTKGKVLSRVDSEKLATKLGVTNNFTIHRADLHQVLLQSLTTAELQTGKSCTDIRQSEDGVKIEFHDGSVAEADYVIACDGINSRIRKKLVPDSVPRYAGYTCWRAVIDKAPSGFDADTTSETWGEGSRFGIVPMTGDRVYWFACVNAPQNDQVKRKFTVSDLARHFGNYHPMISQLLELTHDDQLIWNDIIDLKPLQQFAFGKIVLLGDAAHATTPNMGQGACMAIEDAAILANLIAASNDVEEAFRHFETRRLPRTTKIVDGSWRVGQVAQLENPLLISMRNLALRLTPSSVAEKQMKFITDVSFSA